MTNSVSIGAKALSISGTGVSNGGALRNLAGNSSSCAGAITIGTGGARINSDAGGSLSLGSNLVTAVFQDATIGGSGNTTISGVISGQGRVIKEGSGTLILSGAEANALGGDMVVNSGADNKDSIYFTGAGTITVSRLGAGTPYAVQGPSGSVIIIN